MTSLIVESLNTNGLGDKQGRIKLFKHLHTCKAHVILLQETHTTTNTENQYQKEWKSLHPNHTSVWAYSNESNASRSKGVAILITDLTITPIIDKQIRTDGRAASIQIKFNGRTLQIHSVYAPTMPKQRSKLFMEMGELIYDKGDIILGGDFNMVENPNIDRRGGTRSTAHVAGLPDLSVFKTAYAVKDMWRHKNQAKMEYRRYTPDGTIASRLDRFYASDTLETHFLKQIHIKYKTSDHSLVTTIFSIPHEDTRGTGYWKFNTKLLKDKEYLRLAKMHVTEATHRMADFENTRCWWDHLKPKLKETAILRLVTIAREIRSKIKKLEEDIEDEGNTQDKLYMSEMVAELKNQQREGAMVRSKEEQLVDGEKPNRYFYAREQQRKQ